jgi:hypothetical protein
VARGFRSEDRRDPFEQPQHGARADRVGGELLEGPRPAQRQRSQHGYTPHPRKVPSYYPITAYEAQSGHLLRVQNRPGDVHDGKAAKRLPKSSTSPLPTTPFVTEAKQDFQLFDLLSGEGSTVGAVTRRAPARGG